MYIQSKIRKYGISIKLRREYKINYPNNVWSSLKKPIKQTLVDNIAYVKLASYAAFLDASFRFNTAVPYLKSYFDKCALIDTPRLAFEDKLSTKFLESKLKKANFIFNSKRSILPYDNIATKDGALIALSFGKDSLLSYGIAKEIDIPSKLVFFEDCWDIELFHKKILIKSFEREFNEKVYPVFDECDKLSSDSSIKVKSSEGVYVTNAMNSYMLMMLPFSFYFGFDKIVFGNEQNFNDSFIDSDGYRCYPSYEQSSEWMVEQNKMLGLLTNKKVKLVSCVEPLYNIAETKVLFNRYKDIAKYQMSCSHYVYENKSNRWCYRCPMCAKAFLYLIAVNKNPRCVMFNKNLLEKKHKKLYSLFNSSPDILERPKAVRDEQLFAFYLAFRNEKKGYLIDKFKKHFLKEAKEREDELYRKFFGVHKSCTIPFNLKKKVISIYKEELNNG